MEFKIRAETILVAVVLSLGFVWTGLSVSNMFWDGARAPAPYIAETLFFGLFWTIALGVILALITKTKET